MTFKFKKRVVFIMLLSCLVSSCTSNSEETIDKTNITLPNAKHLIVEKTNKVTKNIGLLTHHNYKTTYRFTYKLSITQGDIHWGGGSGEPKHIIFCNDTTYIHYLKKKYIKLEYRDSIDNTIKYNHQTEIRSFFQKHIDERYFFNFFGNDYWVDISPKDYLFMKESCDEYAIPNDNELSLKTIIKNESKK